MSYKKVFNEEISGPPSVNLEIRVADKVIKAEDIPGLLCAFPSGKSENPDSPGDFTPELVGIVGVGNKFSLGILCATVCKFMLLNGLLDFVNNELRTREHVTLQAVPVPEEKKKEERLPPEADPVAFEKYLKEELGITFRSDN